MRTLQEKYNAVLEGNYSKAEFLRDAKTSQPQFITQYNGFEDAVQILKNKSMIAEAKMQEPKYSTAKPEDTIAPDVLDTGIKFELDKKYGTLDVTDEQYAKCREMAIKNLANDVLYYVKQDSVQLETPEEKMEKAKLNEGTFDPNLVDPVVKAEPEQKLKELSKEETGPTGIALSQKQMDQLHEKGAVMVQVTVKDSDGSIRTVNYPLSYLGYEKGIDDTEDSDLDEYETPKYSEEELAQMAKDQQEHDEETLRRERGLEEQQLKELFKKIITKIITE